jgi:hypothetical protein
MALIDLKPCPNCGSALPKDCYVYIRCEHCGLKGPQFNGGNNDSHADHVDHANAIEAWNELPRRPNKEDV